MDDELEAIVDVLMEAEKTVDGPTVFTRWHHAAEALQGAGYGKLEEYEYAVKHVIQRRDWNPNMSDFSYILNGWGGKEEKERWLKYLKEDPAVGDLRLVKRRKAGPEVDA